MVSIILPWVRQNGFKRCLTAVVKHHGKIPVEIVQEEDVERIGCNPMVNYLVGLSKYEIVCFLHDDSEPQPGFLENAVAHMRNFKDGWGCVGFNDMVHDKTGPCTHWMIHKKMLKYFPDGVFYSEDYVHTRVDLELKEVSKAAGRYKWAENAKIKHLNPINYKNIKRDATALRCYDHEALAQDRKTYIRRRVEQGSVWDEARNPTEIPVEKIFAGRDDYLIIKMSKLFPYFKIGSDIDILCRNTMKFTNHIKSLVMGYKIECRAKGIHYYVDLYKGGRLILRFDLIKSLKEYGLATMDVFNNKVQRFEGGKSYWVPQKEAELKIRMWEYRNNPKKTWHREYIEENAPGLLPNMEPRTKA